MQKIKLFFGAKDDNEAVEIVIEKTVREIEQKQISNDLPESFFDELFAEEITLSDGNSIKAVLDEREETKF